MGESRTFSLPGQYLRKCMKNKQRFLHKNKVQFPQDRFTLFTLFTGSHYGTWKRTDNPPSTGRVTTSPGSASPTPFDRTVMWALLRPTRAKSKCCETGPTLYPPYSFYTPEWMLFHCFGTPVSGEHEVISKRSISDRSNRLKEQNCCWSYFYFSFKDLKNIKLFISGKSKKKITIINENNFALAGNRTRASRVAGENSTTEPPVLLHSYTSNLQDCFWNLIGCFYIKKITQNVSRIFSRS